MGKAKAFKQERSLESSDYFFQKFFGAALIFKNLN